MRAFSLPVVALVLTCMATPAQARDDSWYVEAAVGVTHVPEASFDVGIPAINDGVEANFKKGWEAAGTIGHDFGKVRIEAEASYRRVRTKCINANTPIQGQSTIALGPLTGQTCEGDPFFLADAQLSDSWAVMANGILDFGDDDGVQGFVGAGAGLSSVRHEINAHRLGPGWLDDTGAGFAWQGLAGVRYPLSDHLDVGLKYRFLNVESVNMNENRPSAREVSTRWTSHSLLFTVGYNF